MTTLIESNNPLLILAAIALMALRAILAGGIRIVATAAHALITHRRLFALCALPIVALIAVNLAWPIIIAVAGKALAGGAGTMAFAFFFRP